MLSRYISVELNYVINPQNLNINLTLIFVCFDVADLSNLINNY